MADHGAAGRLTAPPEDDPIIVEQKRAAARAAVEMIRDDMRVGLGTGTTVAELLPLIAELDRPGLRFAATSPATEIAARALGLTVEPLDSLGELDIAIDGTDQVDPAGWLVKGRGGAHTREKIVAAAAACFVVIASANKVVTEIRAPVPVELVPFGVEHTLAALAPSRMRDAPVSPDGGLLADYLGPVDDPAATAARLSATPGVVEHGLFPPELVTEVLIAEPGGIRRQPGAKIPPP
jgi:ribose 5-phosphate isomerase A